MQLTSEQQRAVMDGADRHDNAIRNAINGAQHSAGAACAGCWYRRAGKCRDRECPAHRIMMEAEKCRRMMSKGRLMPNWYIEAKSAETLAEVPFIGEGAKS